MQQLSTKLDEIKDKIKHLVDKANDLEKVVNYLPKFKEEEIQRAVKDENIQQKFTDTWRENEEAKASVEMKKKQKAELEA